MESPHSDNENPGGLAQHHWSRIAAVSLVLGSLLFAGLLFPFSVVDGLLGVGFSKKWVGSASGSASLIFILAWGVAIAVTAGRVFGQTEPPGTLLRWATGRRRRDDAMVHEPDREDSSETTTTSAP
ncbi:MAG TPA: hypothetical protein DIU15_12055 [Deltaproteobacteria bacterium]|nr:hypothetical protein [Deltaproteobacteria bacterium]HCP46771.1 hypothetical protein [Deltaproteobacteria bacterium]|tara:strand:+ start:18 stop:395 length:378 start_codon:yes stop_codon:yes gene_type:complete